MNTTGEVRLFSVAQFRWRLNRDQLLLLFVTVNLLFLMLDVLVAHSENAFRPVYEWIPIIACWPGVVTSFWLALVARPSPAAQWAHIASMLIVLLVGVLGFAFHLQAALAPMGEVSWAWVIFSAPVLAPLSFSGVSLVGLVAMTREEPVGSGQLWLTDQIRLHAPIRKDQHLLWLLGLGLLGAAATSFIDHAQYGYTLFEWIPIVFGTFATIIVLSIAIAGRASRSDEIVYLWTMLLSMVVGAMGFAFHLSRDMADTGALTFERMRDFAPIAAPMLFADLGLLGLLIAILPAQEQSPAGASATEGMGGL